MAVSVDNIYIKTDGECHIVDITPEVNRILSKSGIQDGLVSVFVPGATGAVTTIEYEPGLVRDMKELMEKLVPRNKDYFHNQAWHDGNGHSHLRASLLGPSLTVPIQSGRMTLGTWQQIIFVELDNKPRSRNIIVQIIG